LTISAVMKIKSKSVGIIKYNNLLCQVNVLLQFHNQLKDDQCKPSTILEQRRTSFYPTCGYVS